MNNKERWELAERLGQKLNLPKHIVFNGLSVLMEAKLVDKILKGDKKAIQKALSLEWYGKESIQEQGNIPDIQLMLWAVRKIGLVRAKKALERIEKMFTNS